VRKTERELTGLLVGVAQNVVAGVVLVLAPVVLGGLYALYSDNPQIVLLWVVIIMIVLNSFATLSVLWRQRTAAGPRSEDMLLRDAESGTLYLVDNNGKAREIPDDHTFSFLEDALGILGEMPAELSTAEIVQLRGEKLTSVREWRRPLTPQEQEARELKSKLSRMLSIEAALEESTTTQRIRVTLTNSGKELIHVEKAMFQHHDLPEAAISPGHQKEDIYTVIPFDESAANVSPGSSLTMDLELGQTWQRRDIDRIKGRWGFLLLDVVYRGKPIEQILFPI